MTVKMNELRVAILAVLSANAEKAFTLAELSQAVGMEVKSGSVNAMVSAGMVEIAGEVEVEKMGTREVNAYKLGSVASCDKVKMNNTRSAVLNTLADGNAYTLAQLSQACGLEVKSGSMNTLVSVGMVDVAGTVKVACVKKATVKAYKLGKVSA